MKKSTSLMIVMLVTSGALFAQVSINNDGSSPDGSTMLDVKSTDKGFLPPRVADTNSISTPPEGLLIYDLSSHCMRYYNGTRWSECMGFTAWSCGNPFTINHVAGTVSPVTKTVTYGTVNDIPGAPSKCWITSNLGADQQAPFVNDATEASAGWYWQFNRKQGYKHDGATRTPNSTWITSISENSDWTGANDPCTIELGSGWRIPTNTEWSSVDAGGSWTNWNGPWNSLLKMHAAGWLKENYTGGSLMDRGSKGYYWSSGQNGNDYGRCLYFKVDYSGTNSDDKASGFSLRCLQD